VEEASPVLQAKYKMKMQTPVRVQVFETTTISWSVAGAAGNPGTWGFVSAVDHDGFAERAPERQHGLARGAVARVHAHHHAAEDEEPDATVAVGRYFGTRGDGAESGLGMRWILSTRRCWR